MNKRRFKTVSAVIVVSIIALTMLQGFQLARLYGSEMRRYSDMITTAISTALYRSKAVRSVHYAMAFAGDSRDSLSITGRDMATADTLQNISISMRDGAGNNRVKMYVLNFDRLRGEAVDSLLVEELAVCGIHDYELYLRWGDDMRRFDHRSAVTAARDGRSGGRIRKMLVERNFDMAGPGNGDRLSVRVELADPRRRMLAGMSGIIASSALIVVLVASALIYLLRTLFRFKSLERMRMDLTHNITHELKTPIAVACAAGDSLLNFEQMASDPVVRREYIGIMQRELGQLASMVERILRMSVEQSEEFSLDAAECEASEVVAEAVGEQRMRTGKPAVFDVDVGRGLTLRADRFHLTKAIGNLLDNAVKYSGREVHVGVRAYADGGNVVFEVADDGMGMARGETGRIFEKVYRIPTGDLHEVKGYGLGLYYVRTVAERHGGSVRAESAGRGRGSRFIITLPKDGESR